MATRSNRTGWLSYLVAALVACALTFAPTDAMAQDNPNAVSPTGKGIAGGAMLGAEVVLITTAIIDPDPWWPYLVFGLVGAGGGAVGGYFVEQVDDGNTPEPSLYMLAGGMALIIPTIVAIYNAVDYDPEEDEDLEEEDGEGDGDGETEAEGEIKVEARRGRLPLALMGLDFTGEPRISPGIPAVAVTPMYSQREIATYGVEQETVVHVPLVSGSF